MRQLGTGVWLDSFCSLLRLSFMSNTIRYWTLAAFGREQARVRRGIMNKYAPETLATFMAGECEACGWKGPCNCVVCVNWKYGTYIPLDWHYRCTVCKLPSSYPHTGSTVFIETSKENRSQ